VSNVLSEGHKLQREVLCYAMCFLTCQQLIRNCNESSMFNYGAAGSSVMDLSENEPCARCGRSQGQ
jgi:hypothetical protein